MQTAHRRLVELDVAVLGSVGASERHRGDFVSRLTHEPNLLADVASLNDFEAAREELEGAIDDPLRLSHGRTSLRADRSMVRERRFEAEVGGGIDGSPCIHLHQPICARPGRDLGSRLGDRARRLLLCGHDSLCCGRWRSTRPRRHEIVAFEEWDGDRTPELPPAPEAWKRDPENEREESRDERERDADQQVSAIEAERHRSASAVRGGERGLEERSAASTTTC
jgi:hypothetical protein